MEPVTKYRTEQSNFKSVLASETSTRRIEHSLIAREGKISYISIPVRTTTASIITVPDHYIWHGSFSKYHKTIFETNS